MESRCPSAALQTSGRLLSSHSTLPLNIWQPLHPCTPPPSPTASQHLPHNLLTSEANPVKSSKHSVPRVVTWSHMLSGGGAGLVFIFFLNFQWIHNSLKNMPAYLTGSHWEACLKLKCEVNINLLKSCTSFCELEGTIKKIMRQKPILCWWHVLWAKRITSHWEKTDRTRLACDVEVT